MTEKKLKILFIAAELTPLAKVGGLADVIGALPKALNSLEIDARIIIPKYGIISQQKYPTEKIAENVNLKFKNIIESFNILKTNLPDSQVPVYLIDNYKYLGQNGIYFEQANAGPLAEAERFIFFSQASLAATKHLNWQPSIIHVHDWHVGLIPLLLKIYGKTEKHLKNLPCLLTIHNLEYQGWYSQETVFNALKIKKSDHSSLLIYKHGQINSLQQAIINSDFINTVSPTYAQEILTPEYGAGLQDDLKKRQDNLVGILNGIDTKRFNPLTDQQIKKNYSSRNLTGKKECKKDLQQTFNLPTDPNVPILGIVSRLANQKGLDLIHKISEQLAKKNIQFILLGTGDPAIEKMMRQFSSRFPKKVGVKIEFNAHLAQQVYAGSDMFLMPSRFEPCGLGQMIAMRYGTIPIVRATGGLKDTVVDYQEKSGQGDGFVFKEHEPLKLLEAINRALIIYKNQNQWYNIVRRVMEKDFTWSKSAKEYLNLYHKIKKTK